LSKNIASIEYYIYENRIHSNAGIGLSQIAGLRTTIAAAISLGAVSRYKGAEYVREFRRTASASDSRGRDKSAIKGL
jgi:hypothetical protein